MTKTITLPPICPRCKSANTIYMSAVEVQTCRDCDLDYWWSEDDQEIVTSGASSAWTNRPNDGEKQ